jgi:hypothetical protein
MDTRGADAFFGDEFETFFMGELWSIKEYTLRAGVKI